MKFSTNIKTAMILAAGFGTRLKPLTLTTPKALVEVGGMPMLLRIINQLKSTGINKIIINTHYLAEQIEQYVKNISDIEILLSHEKAILDTGGGILNAMNKFNVDTLLTVNCDCLLVGDQNPLLQLIDNWDENKMEILLLLQERNKSLIATANGDFNLNKENRIIRTNSTHEFMFPGAYIVNKNFFKGFVTEPFSITKILFKSTEGQHPYFGVQNQHQWIDIGTMDALKIANKMLG